MPLKASTALLYRRPILSLAVNILTAPLAVSSPANAAAFSFIQIDAPGANLTTGTQASGINDAGQIVGSFGTGGFEAPSRHGFLDTGGNFSQIDVPHVSGNTQAFGINSAGQIVGSFADSAGTHGFLDTGGNFSQIDVPNASATRALGINDAGQIVGSFDDNTGTHGFLDTSSHFAQIDVPSALGTTASGINAAGQIAGYFVSNFGPNPAIGFLDVGGNFTLIMPGGRFGNGPASGINDAGQIVGTFSLIGNHGYLATPVPEPSSLILLGLGLTGLGLIHCRRR